MGDESVEWCGEVFDSVGQWVCTVSSEDGHEFLLVQEELTHSGFSVRGVGRRPRSLAKSAFLVNGAASLEAALRAIRMQRAEAETP